MAGVKGCSTTSMHCLSFLLLLSGIFSGDASPISSPERHRTAPGLDDGRGGVVDPSLLEQDSEVDMQNLLETLRGQFLRTFNLSGHGPLVQPGAPRVQPPEYMLELYNRFANDRTSMPSANIVRSFKNEGKGALFGLVKPLSLCSCCRIYIVDYISHLCTERKLFFATI